MKRLLLLFFFCFSLSFVKAQSSVYHSFPGAGALWRENSGDYNCNCCRDYQVNIDGDTIISGTTYHKLKWAGIIYDSPNPATTGSSGSYWGCQLGSLYSYYYLHNSTSIYYPGAFREDVSNKKVYFIPAGELTDTLLYDFNLSVGDTLPGSYTHPTIVSTDTVSSIDSVLIGSIYHKRFNISQTANPGPAYVSIIEGVGSTFGFLGILMPPFEIQNVLDCFTDTTGIYTTPGSFCTMLSVNISEPSEPEDNVFVYPNPGEGKYKLNINGAAVTDAVLEVKGLLGNTIITMKIKENVTEIDLTNQPKGIYFLRVSDSNGNSAVKKIVKQ
ncbi:MAG: hypothetical protein JWP12_931 [Bacteroidetes bacterium]|nr:hypothetical protein [Bacteroidota bacterium]